MCYDIYYTMCHHITPKAEENGAKMRGKTAGKEKNKRQKKKGKYENRHRHCGIRCRMEKKEKL